jgi:uncharacterized protein YgiM (DUF1202 family)
MPFFDSSRAGSRRVRAALVAAVLAGGASIGLAQNVGDTVYVSRPSLMLRDKKGASGVEVAEVKKNAQLKVMAREEKWLLVQAANGVQGWVLETSLSPKKVSGGIGAFAGMSETSGADVGAAGKGLREQAEQLAVARGQNPKLVDGMMDESKAARAEIDQFMRDGGIGEHKK